VPAPLLNYDVVSPKEYHWQCGTIEYDLRISYKFIPSITENWVEGLPRISSYEYEELIARRILLELMVLFKNKRAPILVNLGIWYAYPNA
jgi:propionate CoA-transferase